MSRYAAAAGVRNNQGNVNGPHLATELPFLVVVGPSGNVVAVPGPSGASSSDSQDFTGNYRGAFHTFDHSALAWFRNEIITSWKTTDASSLSDWGFAWQPYGQDAGQRVNDLNYLFDTGVNLSEDMMFDGDKWKTILHSVPGGAREVWSFKRIPGGGVFWTGPGQNAYMVNANYGVYEGDDPLHTGDAGGGSAPSGWRPRSGLMGRAPFDVISSAAWDRATGNIVNLCGIRNLITNISAISQNINDIVEFRGTIYVAFQHGVIALRHGGKGQWLFNEALFQDTGTGTVNQFAETSNYTSRLDQNVTGGSKGRVFAEHGGQLYMLSNDGKIHNVKPDGVTQVANLSELGTPWASGIVGGSITREPAGAYAGASVRRCYMTSFNGQLHAFLNFQSNFNKVKGVTQDSVNIGRGVFWATSFDGSNWTDQSPNLPASGIISPSGGHLTGGTAKRPEVINWLAQLSPYRFSGFTGAGATPSIPGPSGQFSEGYDDTGIGGSNSPTSVFPAQPSGFRQMSIPLWTSGNLIDPVTTSFGSLKVPLEFNTISGYLFPTDIRYPAGFGFQSAVSGGPLSQGQGGLFLPSGVGPSGWDYTGCDNYHISGFVDEQKDRLKLYFSQDFLDGGTLFFELDTASGWHRTNHTPNSRQLNGYIPIMLYDPEIVIPSGGVLDPNPAIDEVNKTATVKYRIYDWPFYDTVDVIGEYSTDYGASWSRIGIQKNVSTGSPTTDPSGVIGAERTFVWNWTGGPHPLSKNQWYPHVQIRLRAVDKNFDPKNVAP